MMNKMLIVTVSSPDRRPVSDCYRPPEGRQKFERSYIRAPAVTHKHSQQRRGEITGSYQSTLEMFELDVPIK